MKRDLHWKQHNINNWMNKERDIKNLTFCFFVGGYEKRDQGSVLLPALPTLYFSQLSIF